MNLGRPSCRRTCFLQPPSTSFREGGSATDVYPGSPETSSRPPRPIGSSTRGVRVKTKGVSRRTSSSDRPRLSEETLPRLRRRFLPTQNGNSVRRRSSTTSTRQPNASSGGEPGASQLAAARSAYRIGTPRGVGLSKTLRKDWERYRAIAADLDETVFVPAQEQLDEIVERTTIYSGSTSTSAYGFELASSRPPRELHRPRCAEKRTSSGASLSRSARPRTRPSANPSTNSIARFKKPSTSHAGALMAARFSGPRRSAERDRPCR